MAKYKKLIAVFLVVVVLALVFTFLQKQFQIVRAKSLDFLSLPLRPINFFINEIKSIFSYRAILKENLALKRQLGWTRQKKIINLEILKEDERLSKILSFRRAQSFRSTVARVIGRDPINWFFSLIIDRGNNDNIRKDCAVISPGGAVGKIFETGDSSSKVILINDPNLKIAALIQRSREQGIISGRLSGFCQMYYLDKDSDVVSGDLVISSGLNGSFPRGILIGEVKSVELDASGLNKIALIKPAVDFSKLEEVIVVLNE
ncbi:MAG: rod shape-determining protein MreC [Candidatus Omnitrophota bacterium]